MLTALVGRREKYIQGFGKETQRGNKAVLGVDWRILIWILKKYD
jgi:hypothetical protein